MNVNEEMKVYKEGRKAGEASVLWKLRQYIEIYKKYLKSDEEKEVCDDILGEIKILEEIVEK